MAPFAHNTHDRTADIAHLRGNAPDELPAAIRGITAPHINSFNEVTARSLDLAVADLEAAHISIPDSDGNPTGRFVHVKIDEVMIDRPSYVPGSTDEKSIIYPADCRGGGKTYEGRMVAKVAVEVEGGANAWLDLPLGDIPIMVGSNRCHLEGKSPSEMVALREEAVEMGGYFICNGNERIIRMLIMGRSNFPVALIRPSFSKRGPTYTPYGIQIRCKRPDTTFETNYLHYLSDGNVNFRFAMYRREYFVPIVLLIKALAPLSDMEVFQRVTLGDDDNTFAADRIELALRTARDFPTRTREEALAFLGSKFRVALMGMPHLTDIEVGEYMIRRHILVHLDSSDAKADLCCMMLRKLLGLVAGDIVPENADAASNQEILTAGQLYLLVVKEQLQEWLRSLSTAVKRQVQISKKEVAVSSVDWLKTFFSKQPATVGRHVNYLLNTGNLRTVTGLDLMQLAGFTVVAEKLNWYRYLSHFGSVHRGQFFAEMKTTTVRKLLPESWGFLCPVHTPDGSPCGLLNHMAQHCVVTTSPVKGSGTPIRDVLRHAGVVAPNAPAFHMLKSVGRGASELVTVLVDGEHIGYLPWSKARSVEAEFRHAKVESLKKSKAGLLTAKDIPHTLEVTVIPPTAGSGGAFPGIFIFSGPQRMMRPVVSLGSNAEELVGSLEQVFMNLACVEEDVVGGITTHRDRAPTDMLSIVASLTPFSDMNQSPRNMYQCQMGKQTMGTPMHAICHRTDNKVYRIQNVQTPLVRPNSHLTYGMDNYPHGVNAVVAVISYTGYDMEDAMIINKQAFERGFGHGSVYKHKFVDLNEYRRRGQPVAHFFDNITGEDAEGNPTRHEPTLDADGLPHIGMRVTKGTPLYVVKDESTGKHKTQIYKDAEPAYIEEVRLVDTNQKCLQKVGIKFRLNRNPVIGDKFSSRHGQKGVLSQLWPHQDMPFTEGGLVPDVIINPHAFPSRMTIGMLMESAAAKAGCLHALFADSTPFVFDEETRAVDYFGEQLAKSGYNYYGSEPMYSGTDGREMHANIFVGCVYYQRLRHMVSDKHQVRSTGPINALTMQPLKGRKVGGGIRFGEMERDSLLAHGSSFLIRDRLLKCSDAAPALVCKDCGSILGPCAQDGHIGSAICGACGSKAVTVVEIPYIVRYLAVELACMNVRLSLKASPLC